MPRRKKLTTPQKIDKSLAFAGLIGEALHRIDLDQTGPELRKIIEDALAAQAAVETNLREARRLSGAP